MVKRALLFAVAALLSVSLGRAETFTIPAGSTIHCRLTETVSTKLNFQGDAFTATVTEPYVVNDRQIIPVGATITGRIADLVRPGRVRGVGEMRLAPEQITFPDLKSAQAASAKIKAGTSFEDIAKSRGLKPADIDLKTALGLLALPRDLGRHPETGEKILAGIGRFCPYIRHGDSYRSLPADDDVLTIGLNRAVSLLAEPKSERGRSSPAPRF